jgi:hypothetical protein
MQRILFFRIDDDDLPACLKVVAINEYGIDRMEKMGYMERRSAYMESVR